MKTFNGDLPDEVLAVAAEGRVFEEPRDELVVLDLVDVLLLQGAVPLPVDHPLLGAFDVVELLVVVGPHVAAVGQIENKCFYFSKRSVPGWGNFFFAKVTKERLSSTACFTFTSQTLGMK